ncbi:hypothetical protein NX059_003363 [Plenodomus lindquistii]|nr:hypothetical protein NX059_003363 [Plenodomus lindquistii]
MRRLPGESAQNGLPMQERGKRQKFEEDAIVELREHARVVDMPLEEQLAELKERYSGLEE